MKAYVWMKTQYSLFQNYCSTELWDFELQSIHNKQSLQVKDTAGNDSSDEG